MLTEDRRRRIVERLRTQERVLAADLAVEFGVSPDTVRRDLRELDDAGVLRRVHGGALPREGETAPFAVRARRAPEAKARLARVAAAGVRDGQVVLLDGGTTTLELARALPRELRATVLTTCLPIALELADRPGIDLQVIGGAVRTGGRTTTGAAAVAALQGIRPDVLVLGVCALHPEAGITTDDPEERDVKRAMLAGAGEVVVLADRDKLGTALPFAVAPLSAVTRLVTDDGDAAGLQPYRAAGIEVVSG